MSVTIATFAGLNTCLPRTRTRNLLEIAISAASAAIATRSVRNSKVRDSEVISGLSGSKRGSLAAFVPANCVMSATMTMTMAFSGRIPKSSARTPYATSVPSTAIW